jgi:hypothetical protein
MEEWKNIAGYEGLYQVNDLGEVKSLHREVLGKDGKRKSIKSRIMVNQKCSNGYLFVALSKEGKTKMKLIHRLVAIAFVKGFQDGKEVNHINEDKTDNKASNLEWITHQGNSVYGTKIQRTQKTFKERSVSKGANNPMFGRSGSKNPRSIKIAQLDMNGKLIKVFDSAASAAKELNGNASFISRTAKGYYSQALGYKWKYLNKTTKQQ